LESGAFTVSPWDGIAVTDIRKDGNGIAFNVPHYDYPQTYASEFAYIGVNMDEAAGEQFCETCSFRPWAKSGVVEKAIVTVERKNGTKQNVAATRRSDGTWFAPVALFTGDRAYVDRGGVVDNNGEINGVRSAVVDGADRRVTVLTLSLAHKTLTMRLADAQGAPLAGRRIDVLADGASLGSLTTRTDGTAELRLKGQQAKAGLYEVRFAGDADYAPSSASVRNA
jgi:hypothetical protein